MAKTPVGKKPISLNLGDKVTLGHVRFTVQAIENGFQLVSDPDPKTGSYVKFEVKNGNFSGRFGSTTYTVGRDNTDIIFPDEYGETDKGISRVHAKFTIRGDSLTVEDLGSRNGTFKGVDEVKKVFQPRTPAANPAPDPAPSAFTPYDREDLPVVELAPGITLKAKQYEPDVAYYRIERSSTSDPTIDTLSLVEQRFGLTANLMEASPKQYKHVYDIGEVTRALQLEEEQQNVQSNNAPMKVEPDADPIQVYPDARVLFGHGADSITMQVTHSDDGSYTLNYNGKYFTLTEGETASVGRKNPNDPNEANITLSGNYISRDHAEFHVKGGKLMLQDNYSRNGTYIVQGPEVEIQTPEREASPKERFEQAINDLLAEYGIKDTIKMLDVRSGDLCFQMDCLAGGDPHSNGIPVTQVPYIMQKFIDSIDEPSPGDTFQSQYEHLQTVKAELSAGRGFKKPTSLEITGQKVDAHELYGFAAQIETTDSPISIDVPGFLNGVQNISMGYDGMLRITTNPRKGNIEHLMSSLGVEILSEQENKQSVGDYMAQYRYGKNLDQCKDHEKSHIRDEISNFMSDTKYDEIRRTKCQTIGYTFTINPSELAQAIRSTVEPSQFDPNADRFRLEQNSHTIEKKGAVVFVRDKENQIAASYTPDAAMALKQDKEGGFQNANGNMANFLVRTTEVQTVTFAPQEITAMLSDMQDMGIDTAALATQQSQIMQ